MGIEYYAPYHYPPSPPPPGGPGEGAEPVVAPGETLEGSAFKMPPGKGVLIEAPTRQLAFDLSVARNVEEHAISGTFVIMLEAPDADTNMDIRFNLPQNDQVGFRLYTQVRVAGGFSRLYFSNSAQAGKKITLLIGGEGVTAAGT